MAEQTWLDPWLKLREMTAQRNDVQTVADRYSKLERLALAQLNDLRQRPNTRQSTIVTLTKFYEFAHSQAEWLWSEVVKLETALEQETERVNTEAR